MARIRAPPIRLLVTLQDTIRTSRNWNRYSEAFFRQDHELSSELGSSPPELIPTRRTSRTAAGTSTVRLPSRPDHGAEPIEGPRAAHHRMKDGFRLEAPGSGRPKGAPAPWCLDARPTTKRSSRTDAIRDSAPRCWLSTTSTAAPRSRREANELETASSESVTARGGLAPCQTRSCSPCSPPRRRGTRYRSRELRWCNWGNEGLVPPIP